MRLIAAGRGTRSSLMADVKNILVFPAGTEIAFEIHDALKNSKFVNCSAKRGGALYLREYTYTISDNSFENCHANKGGVIYSTSFGVLKNNNITNCSADIGSLYYMQEEYNEENFIFSSISRFECDIPSAVWSKGKYNVTFKLDKSSNGVVVLTVAGESRNSSVVNGNATIELFNFENIYSDTDLDYKIEYVEDGEIKYSQNSKFNVRTAGPGEYSFDVTCPEEIFHGNMLNANGSVSNHIDGQVLIYLGTSSFPYQERFDVDDKYYVYSYDLNVRKYNLIFKFIPEDSYYESKTFNTTLTVSPFVITLPETVIIGTYNDGKYSFADSKMKIEWDFDVDYYDSFIVYIDGKEYFTGQTTISSLDLSNLTYGQHTYEFKYLGNTYDSVSKSGSFKTGYSAVSPSLDVEWNDKAEVVVYLPDGATGSATVKIDDDEYPVQVNDSKARVTVSNLLKGTYNIGISYSGDGNFPKITLENMSKLYSFYKIHVPESIKLGEKYALINLTLPKNAKGNLVVEIYDSNNKSLKNITKKLVNGTAAIPLINSGVYGEYLRVIAKYTGTDYSVIGSDKNYITINPKISVPAKMLEGEKKYVSINLPGKEGTLKLYMDVYYNSTYKEVTKTYTAQLVNGKANISLSKFKSGSKIFFISFIEKLSNGSSVSYIYNSYSDFEILKPLNIVTSSIYYGGSVKIQAYKAGGKPLAYKYITVKINGKTFKKVKTNKNGLATVKLGSKYTPKKYTVTAVYGKNKVSKKIKVKQVLSLKKVTIKKSAKKLILTATLKKGKTPMKKKKVTFRFKGKKYTAKTNKKGIAKVTIKKAVLKTLKAGKKLTYKATYCKTTVKRTVKVKK